MQAGETFGENHAEYPTQKHASASTVVGGRAVLHGSFLAPFRVRSSELRGRVISARAMGLHPGKRHCLLVLSVAREQMAAGWTPRPESHRPGEYHGFGA